jgi:xanthine/CO dehydrogenase XdhC/CoxF family maturation factor
MEAAKVIQTGKPSLISFGIADESAWQVGLACGGKISIYIEKID